MTKHKPVHRQLLFLGGVHVDRAHYFILLQGLYHVCLGKLILVHFCLYSQTQSAVNIEAVATQF